MAAFLLVAAPPARAEPPVPLLWKVSDADNSVYLLGSFHLLKKDDYPLAADVDAAFADAEQLAFELSPAEANSPALAQQMMQAAVRTQPGSLQQDLGPELWKRLQAYAASNGLPLAQLASFEPWYVALTVSIMEMGKMGLWTRRWARTGISWMRLRARAQAGGRAGAGQRADRGAVRHDAAGAEADAGRGARGSRGRSGRVPCRARGLSAAVTPSACGRGWPAR